jgi:flagellar P-ring protein FlgI
MIRGLGLILALLLVAVPALAQSVRLRDLVDFDGVRGNDLVGYGLVVGLDGSGDSLRNSPFTEEILSNILERLGVNVTGEQLRSRNVAAVFVTGELRPFARAGSRIDLTVSAMGDARSLLGGTLVMTPLKAADGLIYAVGQGTVIAGGARAEGDAAEVVEGVPTSGAIPSGARVEREVPFVFNDMHSIRLALRNPDFTTAERIERAINDSYGARVSQMLDSGTVLLNVRATREPTPAHAIGRIENLSVQPQSLARVVVDQRSGTIVLGEDVRISRVAVSQGGLVLRVEERPEVVQPNPFAQGETVVVPRTVAELGEEMGAGLVELSGGTSLREVIDGLNALGVSPQDMIDILQTIHAAGALHADFVVR